MLRLALHPVHRLPLLRRRELYGEPLLQFYEVSSAFGCAPLDSTQPVRSAGRGCRHVVCNTLADVLCTARFCHCVHLDITLLPAQPAEQVDRLMAL